MKPTAPAKKSADTADELNCYDSFLMKALNQYTLATASNGDYTKLIENVNKWIQEGFKPFGNIAVIPFGEQFLLCQAMVKNKKRPMEQPAPAERMPERRNG